MNDARPKTGLKDIGDVAGKKVLLRLDFNVPVQDGVVFDDFRIRKSMPTIEFLLSRGARLIIVSHREGKSEGREDNTLRPVFEYLKKTLAAATSTSISFVEDYVNDATREAVDELKNGEVLLFENLRFHEGEKGNDDDFAQSLASLADIYVNDAFSVSHRTHASIVSVPKYLPSYMGMLFESEVEHLSKMFTPPHPFLFILGGAKFSTKIPLLRKFLDIADTVFVGGALANDFFKAMGYEVGKSVVSGGVGASGGALDLSGMLGNNKIMLPTDVVVKGPNGVGTKKSDAVAPDEMILDAGADTLAALGGVIESAKCVLWNGPLGNFEIGFQEGTLQLAKKIAQNGATGGDVNGAESVLGGADTLAAISALKLEDKFTFVSSGGGAMLDFLANGTLPGIEALEKAA